MRLSNPIVYTTTQLPLCASKMLLKKISCDGLYRGRRSSKIQATWIVLLHAVKRVLNCCTHHLALRHTKKATIAAGLARSMKGPENLH